MVLIKEKRCKGLPKCPEISIILRMKNFIDKRPQAIPCIVAAVFLLLALLDWPYGYYQLLRLVVTGVAAWVAYIAYDAQKKPLMVIFIIVALLFYPLIPIHLDRETWAGIDVLCAIGFIVAIFIHQTKRTEGKQ